MPSEGIPENNTKIYFSIVPPLNLQLSHKVRIYITSEKKELTHFQPTFTKSTSETLEKGVKYIQS